MALFAFEKNLSEALRSKVGYTMIWIFLIFSLGLASTRDIKYVEPEYLDELRASGQDEKFAELLGIDVTLVRPDSSEQRSEGSRMNHVSYLGDILLTEEQERQGINFDKLSSYRWPSGNMPYYISNDFNPKQKKFIKDAIDSFKSQCNNVKVTECKGVESDCVYIISGNGCYSYLGRRGGHQVLSLEIGGCLINGTVQHEIMHAIGFTHEHNRSDRDDHVAVLWSNIPSSWHSQYQKVDDDTFTRIGDYDYCSVMHYPMWAPETYLDAFLIPDKVDKNCLGQDVGVTPTDVQKVNALYS